MSEITVEKIKQLAKSRNESIREIGIKSGVGETAIFRWDRNEPRISTLKKVADYLGVDYKYLLP